MSVAAADTVRAAVFVAPGKPMELRSFSRPELAAGEALVEIICCTLCGSDLHSYLDRRSTPTPGILGHEAVGRIVELGPGGSAGAGSGEGLAVGDRISWSVAAGCGRCFFCRSGLPQKCERLLKYGHESCDGARPLTGGLASYIHLVQGTAMFRVPPQVPDVIASSANCATATVAAAMRAAEGARGKTVVIQGAGMLGLTTAAMARVDGAEHVVAVDVDPRRLAMAERFGATAVVDVSKAPDELADVVRQFSDGRGADLIFEMSGASEAMQQGLALLRTGGQYILVGAVKSVGLVPLDPEQVVRRMWRFQGIHNYAPVDLAHALEFLSTHGDRFPFADLVSAEFSLEEADAAFDHMLKTGAVRVAVRP